MSSNKKVLQRRYCIGNGTHTQPYYAPGSEIITAILPDLVGENSLENQLKEVEYDGEVEPMFQVGDLVHVRAKIDSPEEETSAGYSSSEHFGHHCAAYRILEIRREDQGFELLINRKREQEHDGTTPDDTAGKVESEGGGSRGHDEDGDAAEGDDVLNEGEEENGLTEAGEEGEADEEEEEEEEEEGEEEEEEEEDEEESSPLHRFYYRLDMSSDSNQNPLPCVGWWHESQLSFAPLAMDNLSSSEDDDTIMTDVPADTYIDLTGDDDEIMTDATPGGDHRAVEGDKDVDMVMANAVAESGFVVLFSPLDLLRRLRPLLPYRG